MSSRSTTKAAASVLDPADQQNDEFKNEASDALPEQNASLQLEQPTVDMDYCVPVVSYADSISPEPQATPDDGSELESDKTTDPEPPSDTLGEELDQLLSTVGVVEELSRRARATATTDLGFYEALVASHKQYAARVNEAIGIRERGREVLERAFGQEAKDAAEQLFAECERVLQAVRQLEGHWQQRASTFLEEHSDVELLLSERQAQEEQARQQEVLTARARRLQALIASSDDAFTQGLSREGRRLVEVVEREFPEQTSTIQQLRLRLEECLRAGKDNAACQALADAAEHQGRGDLEGTVNILEQVDVHGLSVDVSQDVFGRWSDACSRLAQTAAATLVRCAPTHCRGLILYADPAYPNGLIVFSSLGMGPGFPQGKVVTDIAVLRRARQFREAAPLPVTSWASVGPSTFAVQSTAPVRH
jgi:hypothetical protein